MSRKGPGIDLAQALGRNKTRQETEAAVITQSPEPRMTGQGGQTVQSGAMAGQRRAPSRAGQTNISGWFDMPVKLKLDELRIARQRALGRRVTQQELLSEAYNDLFKKYGLPEMAPGGPDR